MSNSFQFKRIARSILLCLVFAVSIYPVALFAGITGKISGKVVDAKTNEPLPSVNLVVVGLSLGAVTDVDGNYFILNVPPGTYSVRASLVGYEQTRQTDVVVSSDRTTPLNFKLSQSPVQGEEVVVTADRVIVKKDVSSSELVATGDQITVVPMVRSVNDFMAMQAGVDFNSNGDMEIRGGSMSDAAILVNGLASVDNRSNRPVMQVNLSTIKEMSIIQGGFQAEYGNLRSGLINIVTKDPDPSKIHVSLDVAYSPARQKHSGAAINSIYGFWTMPFAHPDVCYKGTQNSPYKSRYDFAPGTLKNFTGWNTYANNTVLNGRKMTADQWRDVFLWQHALEGSGNLHKKYNGSDTLGYLSRGQKEIKYADKPDYIIEGTISGGVPYGEMLGDLAYMISYKVDNKAFALPTSRDYFVTDNFMVKLVSNIAGNMKIGVEGSYGEINTVGRRENGGFDNDYVKDDMDIFNSMLLNSNRNFPRYAWWPNSALPFNIYQSMVGLSFDHMINSQTFYNVRISVVNIKNSCGPWGPDAYRDTNAVGNIGWMRLNEAPWGFWIGTGYRNIGLSSMSELYSGGQRDNGKISTISIKFDLTSQLDKYHQLKTGLEIVSDQMSTDFQRYRYDHLTDRYRTKWDRYPYRLGVYVQDKIEFEGMIANIGIRLDKNSPNTDWIDDGPYSKYFTGRYKYKLYSDAPKSPAKGQTTISPRLGISHPISEDVKLYFSYGHFYSMPSTTDMYRLDMNLRTSGVTAVGNPSLRMPKTIAYELGLDYDIANAVLLHVAGYYRNNSDQIGKTNDLYPKYNNSLYTVSYEHAENNQFQDVRGFEIQLTKNYGWLSGFANYTYLVSSSTTTGRTQYYQDPVDEVLLGAYTTPEPAFTVPSPKFKAAIYLKSPSDFGPEIFGFNPLADITVSTYAKWNRGNYETINPNNILGPSSEVRNNVQWKSDWRFDLRLAKAMKIADVSMELYMDIYNLFNNKLFDKSAFSTENSNAEREEYYKRLHLPLYKDPRFDSVRDYAKGWYIPGEDQLGELPSKEKPYIVSPSLDYRMYTRNLRYSVFGIRVNI